MGAALLLASGAPHRSTSRHVHRPARPSSGPPAGDTCSSRGQQQSSGTGSNICTACPFGATPCRHREPHTLPRVQLQCSCLGCLVGQPAGMCTVRHALATAHQPQIPAAAADSSHAVARAVTITLPDCTELPSVRSLRALNLATGAALLLESGSVWESTTRDVHCLRRPTDNSPAADTAVPTRAAVDSHKRAAWAVQLHSLLAQATRGAAVESPKAARESSFTPCAPGGSGGNRLAHAASEPP